MAQASDQFFLGRLFDPQKGQITQDGLFYDPSNLTTHAVVTGMTGSGKTGLCVAMLEEAALKKIPAIVIDPKGDLTNLLLHFPDLLPADFEPWVDPEEARRAGKTTAAQAEETAAKWKDGLAQWGLGREDLLALQSAVEFGVYTPGSTSGTPVNILASFQAPSVPWEANQEILREEIASSVTALLALIGLTNIDPLRSREHILLSNILENAWSQGQSLDLTNLIMQVQKPSFNRLGAFPLESFFPEKDRFELAMLLNNFLASPSFQTWLQGQTLNIDALLYTPDGKPRHSIFYLAHLSENERMFFVTLLYAAIEAWMHTQRGTSGLRMLVYFDEVLGYLPPVANPPSRPVMLRMIKQARAFGVGLVLATQNPVDLDYKALSNAGTWVIGRLQTERDKARLLEGLQNAGGTLDTASFDKMLSGLGKRVFLLQSVYLKQPMLFSSRWALNYLAGPLTRTQIPGLMKLPGVAQGVTSAGGEQAGAAADQRTKPAADASQSAKQAAEGVVDVRPAVQGSVAEFFLEDGLDIADAARAAGWSSEAAPKSEGLLYKPALLAQAEVRYVSTRLKQEVLQKKTAVVKAVEGGFVRWEEHAARTLERDELRSQPQAGSKFELLPVFLSDARRLNDFNKDYTDWLYRSGAINLRVNDALKVTAGPEVSSAEFREMCSEAARKLADADIQKLEKTYEQKMETLKRKVERQRLEVEEQEGKLNSRRLEEGLAAGELVLGLLGKRRKSLTGSISKRRMTSQTKAALEQERQELETLEAQLKDLEREKTRELTEVRDRWADRVKEINEVALSPNKKDIYVSTFGVLWLPYYLVNRGGKLEQLPAFTLE